MRKTLPLLLLCVFVQFQYAQANIIYVKAAAGGSNNGSNWANAFTDLQNGIAASTTGDQIWVAAGTYKPTTGADETISFILPSGVGIYGGFAGTETLLTQRNWVANSSILSGDIGATGTASDNSNHVVAVNGVASNTRLDGFSIIGGYASGSSSSLWGAGMVIVNSSLTVANCLFTANHTNHGGAGLSFADWGAQTNGVLNLINCSFTYNTGGGGCALFLRGTQTNITGCTVSNNDGDEAIYVNNGTANFDRCVVSGNNSTGGSSTIFVEDAGGIINAYNSLFAGNLSTGTSVLEIRYSSPETHNIWNCTIAGNKSTSSSLPDAVFLSPAANMRNCIVWGNYNNQGISLSNSDVANCIIQGGYNNGTAISSANPLFINPGSGSLAPFDAASYNYMLQSSSTGINGGNNTYTSNFHNLDLNDSARISAGTVDLGCYEKQYCSASVSITPSGATSFCTGSFVTLSASAGSIYNWSNGGTAQNTAVSTQGTYTVTVIDGSGCFGTASQLVNVYPASVQINGSTVICNNTSTTLTATSSNGNIFSWSNGQNNAVNTVTQAGSYTVTVTTLNSCTASANTTVTAHSVTTPVITQNGNVLTSSASTGNQWYLNGTAINGATGQTFTCQQSGNYTVEITESGCTSQASNSLNVVISSLPEIGELNISIYPNPALNTITVTNVTTDTPITITNLLGEILIRQITENEKQRIDISHLAAGLYFLNNRKFVKE